MAANYLDIALCIVLLVFGIAGLRKGLIVEVSALLALFLGIYAALYLSDFAALRLSIFLDVSQHYIDAIAFVVTFIVVVLGINLLGKVLSKVAETIFLGGFDKIGGFLFGALKGILFISIVLMLLNTFHLTDRINQEERESSKLYSFVEKTVPYVYKGFDLAKESVVSHQEESMHTNSDHQEEDGISVY